MHSVDVISAIIKQFIACGFIQSRTINIGLEPFRISKGLLDLSIRFLDLWLGTFYTFNLIEIYQVFLIFVF